MRRKTTIEYKEQIKNLSLVCIGKYVDNSTKIKHKCKLCDFIWLSTPNAIKNSRGCRECNTITTEKYKHQIKDLPILCLEEYINTGTKILHQCKKCNNIWKIKPSHAKNGVGCKKCAIKQNKQNNPFTSKEYKEQIKTKPLTCLEEYIGSGVKIEYMCNVCDNIWLVTPSNVKNGNGCPKCAGRRTSKQKYKNKKTLLYYILFENGVYKIGLTMSSIKKRYSGDSIKYRILATQVFDDGYEAWRWERYILDFYSSKKYLGNKFIKAGITECFYEDIGIVL